MVLATRGTGVAFAVSIYVALAALIADGGVRARFSALTLRRGLARGVAGISGVFPARVAGDGGGAVRVPMC